MTIHHFLKNTQSMTGRLALFFSLVSIVIGVFCFVLITLSLLWSEDRVSERRIVIDRNEAIEHFRRGEANGRIRLDSLTVAYNDINLVPQELSRYLVNKDHFLGEVEDFSKSRMVYMSTYTDKGIEYPIILVSLVDQIEITVKEFIVAIGLVLMVVVILIFIFGYLLSRLSKTLIEPINILKQQLDLHQKDLSLTFSVPEDSADEFQRLAEQLNLYRDEVNSMIKREQAFARYASHELRTPLTVIKGSSNLLLREAETPFFRRQLTRIQDVTLQMSTMVDALLSLVRYERSEDDAPLRKLSKEEIEGIIAQNQAQADEKKLVIDVDIKANPEIKATSAVMIILLGNLLRNAIAATSKGTICVIMDSNSLAVCDEGSGLSSTPNTQGHGLGLLIVEEFCRRYGWQFMISDRLQGGCKAEIQFKGE